MLEQLFGIQYTVGVAGRVFGYYVQTVPDVDLVYLARVHEITPTGNVPVGEWYVPRHFHGESVRVNLQKVVAK
jgi:hypothetical protein